jgi:ATP-dependent helicase/nuclease subunit B
VDVFIAHLIDLCRKFPTRAKWVFVPSHAIGRTLGDRLALAGDDWANLRFVTPLDVALRMGAPFLVERGIDPSDEGLGPALFMRLLLELPEEGGYFRPLATQPQLAVAIWSAVREMRMAGVTAGQLPRDAFEPAEKRDEIAALLSSYERFLDANRRADRAALHQEALAHPDWCPIQAQDCWTVLPDVIWAPLERRLIDATPGERVDAPGRHDGPPPASPPRVDFFHAGGTEAEVEEVFRRVLAAGCPLDHVEIACASESAVPMLWEKACRYDWPVTIAQGLPAALTRPGRALLAFTEWIEDDFAAGRLRRLLQSGDVTMSAAGVPLPSAPRAARLLVKAQAAWGRRTYRLALGRLIRSDRTRADRDDLGEEEREGLRRRADDADALAGWIDGIIGAVPGGDGSGRVDLQPLVAIAERFVVSTAARHSALDALAAASLADAIRELSALGPYSCSLAEGLRFLRERVETLRIGADRPRPGHLHISALPRAAFSGRPRLFVVGLEEGRVFPSAFEDSILLDSERARISPLLRVSSQRVDDAVSAVRARLASAIESGIRVCLSYSCRDLREFRPTYPSWLMLELYRATSGKLESTYEDLQHALGAPRSCVPDAELVAPGESRWWLRGLRDAGEAGRDAVLRRYAPLAAGVRAEAARAADRFSEYDGHVPDAGALLDPCRADRVVSPTQLEDAARCPFRHFLRRGLHVDALETGERERDTWLNPLLRGSLLHDLYASFLRRCRAADRRPAWPADHDWLQAEGRARLERLKADMPPPSLEVEDRETRDLLADLELFARAECDADPDRTPIAFEVAFGRPRSSDDEDDAEPLAQQPCAERVDGAGEEAFEIDERAIDPRVRPARALLFERELEPASQFRRRLSRERHGRHVLDLVHAAGDAGGHPRREPMRLTRPGAGLDDQIPREVRDDAGPRGVVGQRRRRSSVRRVVPHARHLWPPSRPYAARSGSACFAPARVCACFPHAWPKSHHLQSSSADACTNAPETITFRRSVRTAATAESGCASITLRICFPFALVK